jgi:NAD(P)-dependent dehydrogenase (short-subunit alcohol dehydrogenase family)
MSMDRFDLSGRTALVTGASSGLGRHFAKVLHEAGANVVIAARRMERLSELATQLPRSRALACDVTLEEDRVAVVAEAVEAFGSIDILVNNAGVSGPVVASEFQPWQQWEHALAVNLSGLFGMTQLVARHMLEQGKGSIINVASIFGLVGSAPVLDSAYVASKGAVVNLTRGLGAEWANRGVRVNAIAPGWFPSEMTDHMVDSERSQRYIARGCPMGRMGREDELDGALLFFASDASSFCTGQTLAIDGGWTAV